MSTNALNWADTCDLALAKNNVKDVGRVKFLFGQSFQSESFKCGFSVPYQLSDISEIPVFTCLGIPLNSKGFLRGEIHVYKLIWFSY